MKGIILAGGLASRMYPITTSITKQLLPVYDKPMIYYPLSTLMLGGIRDILIIVSGNQLENFTNLLGDGSQFGINITYKIQDNPRGLPDAFLIGEEFINGEEVCLILGDNIFYGNGFSNILKSAINKKDVASLFLYYSNNPENFGVAEFSNENKIISIEEKPKYPKSNYVVTGLYVYDKEVCNYAKTLKESDRGEIEITDLNNIYIKENKLNCEVLGRGFAWLDTGTFDSLCEASEFISLLGKRQGIKISIPEEIAYRNMWIGKDLLEKSAFKYKNNSYGEYLYKLLDSSNIILK